MRLLIEPLAPIHPSSVCERAREFELLGGTRYFRRFGNVNGLLCASSRPSKTRDHSKMFLRRELRWVAGRRSGSSSRAGRNERAVRRCSSRPDVPPVSVHNRPGRV